MQIICKHNSWNWIKLTFKELSSTTRFIVIPSSPPLFESVEPRPNVTGQRRRLGAPVVIFATLPMSYLVSEDFQCYPKQLTECVFLLFAGTFKILNDTWSDVRLRLKNHIEGIWKSKSGDYFIGWLIFVARSRSFAMLWWTRNKVERRSKNIQKVLFGSSNKRLHPGC